MLNLALMIEDNARKYPDREALVLGPTRITYAQLNAMACQVANGLKALGVGRGIRSRSAAATHRTSPSSISAR